ncbi:hypothetical protein V3W47_11400 [Deinococcus sp. YIM 134068]|uniref:hypothetical protein n=1 Tax=Deinococcus lichenicola TaxID=3118910 RepID=UPI002F91C928
MKLRHAVLTAALLSACSPGLDLYTPPDARDYVALCARERALGCQAILPVLSTVQGEVTVLLVNGEDEPEITESLAGKGVSLNDFLTSVEAEEYARANIFLASELRSGQMQTLDGKTHTVECRLEGGTELCRIDGGIEGFNKLEGLNGRRGSVYLMTGLLPF